MSTCSIFCTVFNGTCWPCNVISSLFVPLYTRPPINSLIKTKRKTKRKTNKPISKTEMNIYFLGEYVIVLESYRPHRRWSHQSMSNGHFRLCWPSQIQQPEVHPKNMNPRSKESTTQLMVYEHNDAEVPRIQCNTPTERHLE